MLTHSLIPPAGPCHTHPSIMPTKTKTLGKPTAAKRRRQIRKQPTSSRARNPAAADEPEIILDPNAIIEHAADLRPLYPHMTDQHAQLAHLVVQTGWSIRKIAATMGWSDSWAHSAAQREDVTEYLNRISMRALGWARAQAAGVASQLLSHKSAYIRQATAIDLMERGGLRTEPTRAGAQTFNFNVTLNAAGSVEPEPVVIDQMGPGAVLPLAEGPLKTALGFGGGSLPHVEGTQGDTAREKSVIVTTSGVIEED